MSPKDFFKVNPSAVGQWKPRLAPFEHRSHIPTISKLSDSSNHKRSILKHATTTARATDHEAAVCGSASSVLTGQYNDSTYGHSMYDIDLKGFTGMAKDPVAASDNADISRCTNQVDPTSKTSGGNGGIALISCIEEAILDFSLDTRSISDDLFLSNLF